MSPLSWPLQPLQIAQGEREILDAIYQTGEASAPRVGLERVSGGLDDVAVGMRLGNAIWLAVHGGADKGQR